MHSYDLFIIAIIGASLVWGAWKGLAWQIMSVGSLFVSYFVAANFYDPVARNIVPKLFDVPPPVARYIAMGLLYVASSLLMWLGFNFVRDSIDRFRLKEFDRQIGGLVGAGKGGLLSILITLFTVGVSEPNTRRAVFQSKSGGVIAQVLNAAAPMIPGDYRREIAPYVRQLEEGLERNGRDGYDDYQNSNDGYGRDQGYDDSQYRNDRYDDYNREGYERDGYDGDTYQSDRYQSDYQNEAYDRQDRGYDDRGYNDRSYRGGRENSYDEGDWDARQDRNDGGTAGELLDAGGQIVEKLLPELQKSLQRGGRR